MHRKACPQGDTAWPGPGPPPHSDNDRTSSLRPHTTAAEGLDGESPHSDTEPSINAQPGEACSWPTPRLPALPAQGPEATGTRGATPPTQLGRLVPSPDYRGLRGWAGASQTPRGPLTQSTFTKGRLRASAWDRACPVELTVHRNYTP